MTRILRNLDLLILAVALPVFIGAGLPILGWIAAAIGWTASRVLQTVAVRRGMASGERRTAMRARAISFVARIYIVGATVLVAGLIERKAGLAAGVLSVAVFTFWFVTVLFAERAR